MKGEVVKLNPRDLIYKIFRTLYIIIAVLYIDGINSHELKNLKLARAQLFAGLEALQQESNSALKGFKEQF